MLEIQEEFEIEWDNQRIDLKAKEEEASALKRALESKIDLVLTLEREKKELYQKYETLKKSQFDVDFPNSNKSKGFD